MTLESQLGRGSRFTVRLPLQLELDAADDAILDAGAHGVA